MMFHTSFVVAVFFEFRQQKWLYIHGIHIIHGYLVYKTRLVRNWRKRRQRIRVIAFVYRSPCEFVAKTHMYEYVQTVWWSISSVYAWFFTYPSF